VRLPAAFEPPFADAETVVAVAGHDAETVVAVAGHDAETVVAVAGHDADGVDRIMIAVYYDFASSLCHVAHRAMTRLAGVLDELAISLVWVPIDLAPLLSWRRGHPVSEQRRAHVQGIATALDVDLVVPMHWLDSRAWHALALHQLALDRANGTRLEPMLRERVFTRVFDEARPSEGLDATIEMAREFGLTCDRAALERGLETLERWTRHASHQMVSGVPTFMLAQWPFGGIQEDATMESIFRRWAAKVRRERVSANAAS